MIREAKATPRNTARNSGILENKWGEITRIELESKTGQMAKKKVSGVLYSDVD